MMTMKNSPAIGLLAITILVAIGFAAPAQGAYSLVWSDEFNGGSLNTDDWTADYGNGCPGLCGWGNNELEFYLSQNVTVTGGNLVLTAREESMGGNSFTSGKVHTRDKQSFLYGRIEARAKIPTGGGMWPAFWMMPQDDAYGGWAASGEIDIMEAANNTTSVGGTIHYGGSWPDNTYSGSSYSLGGANFADEYHVYAVEWEPEEIRWYVDDVHYGTKTSAQWYTNTAPGNPLAPFDQDFYIILNAAVGGNYTGCTDPGCITASLPQEFLIDYVRVYQETGNVAPTVEITSPSEGDNPPAGSIEITATAADSDGSIARVEFYNGTTYLGEDTTAPYAFVWPYAANGCHEIIARAIDDGGAFAEDTERLTVGSGCGQAPYHGSPFILPMRIEVEDYDLGGEGVAYHDTDSGNTGSQYRTSEGVDIETCTDSGGGYNAGWIMTNEWLEYTVFAVEAGEYTIETRVASNHQGGVFHLEFNGVDLSGDIVVPVTGGWQTWTTVSATVPLDTGLYTMRYVTTLEGFNINYFEFLEPTTAVQPDLQSAGYRLHPCYPNPFNPSTTIRFDVPVDGRVSLGVYDVRGSRIRSLVEAELPRGRHQAIWNGRDDQGRPMPSGFYFYRLDATGFGETKRMTLIK
jgi:beta-glucanase (GH16 family)